MLAARCRAVFVGISAAHPVAANYIPALLDTSAITEPQTTTPQRVSYIVPYTTHFSVLDTDRMNASAVLIYQHLINFARVFVKIAKIALFRGQFFVVWAQYGVPDAFKNETRRLLQNAAEFQIG